MKYAARRGMEDWLLPETSRAGITRIGCKGSLSASPRSTTVFGDDARGVVYGGAGG